MKEYREGEDATAEDAAVEEAPPITVQLSRRNLMSLLLKLDRGRRGEHTHMTIVKQDLYDVNTEIHVTAEEDAVVYSNRQPGRITVVEEHKFFDPDASISRPVYSSQKNRRTIVDRRQDYEGRKGHLPERRSTSLDRRMGRRVPSPEIGGTGTEGGPEPNEGTTPKDC